MSKNDLDKSHNDGQRDGANDDYEGSLPGGRTYEEQQSYNHGYIHGEGQRDGADGNYTGSLSGGRTSEEQEVYNQGYNSSSKNK